MEAKLLLGFAIVFIGCAYLSTAMPTIAKRVKRNAARDRRND